MEEQGNIVKIYDYLKDKKCKDIALYEKRKNFVDTESSEEEFNYIIIVTNVNTQANKKFALSVMEDMGLEIFPEGYSKGEWIIFDFGNIIIHSFTPICREKYSLDKLYHNKKMNITKQNK